MFVFWAKGSLFFAFNYTIYSKKVGVLEIYVLYKLFIISWNKRNDQIGEMQEKLLMPRARILIRRFTGKACSHDPRAEQNNLVDLTINAFRNSFLTLWSCNYSQSTHRYSWICIRVPIVIRSALIGERPTAATVLGHLPVTALKWREMPIKQRVAPSRLPTHHIADRCIALKTVSQGQGPIGRLWLDMETPLSSRRGFSHRLVDTIRLCVTAMEIRVWEQITADDSTTPSPRTRVRCV